MRTCVIYRDSFPPFVRGLSSFFFFSWPPLVLRPSALAAPLVLHPSAAGPRLWPPRPLRTLRTLCPPGAPQPALPLPLLLRPSAAGPRLWPLRPLRNLASPPPLASNAVPLLALDPHLSQKVFFPHYRVTDSHRRTTSPAAIALRPNTAPRKKSIRGPGFHTDSFRPFREKKSRKR